MRAALLTVSLLAVFAVLPLRAQAGSSVSAQSPQLTRIENETEQIRGLKPTRAVAAQFPSDVGFNRVLTNELHRDNPARELDISQHEMVLLGMLNKNQSLQKIIYGAMENQIIGLYDYKVKVLYVRTHGNKAFGVDRYTVAHEFTHALQDQHWNLNKLLPDQYSVSYRNSDAVSAHHALTEGDAVNTQTIYIARHYSAQEINALYKEANSQPSSGLPTAIERQFYFPYTTGTDFVKTLYGQGGMKAVDGAYIRLPSSTYEIMYPHAYLKHWTPVRVTLHGVKGFSGWKQVDDDVMGALGYKVIMWQFTSEANALRAIVNYRGDRYIFLQNGGRDACLLKSVWQSPQAATVARSVYATSLSARFPGARWTQGATVLSYPGGAVYLKAAGTGLTVAYAPTADLAVHLGTAQTT